MNMGAQAISGYSMTRDDALAASQHAANGALQGYSHAVAEYSRLVSQGVDSRIAYAHALEALHDSQSAYFQSIANAYASVGNSVQADIYTNAATTAGARAQAIRDGSSSAYSAIANIDRFGGEAIADYGRFVTSSGLMDAVGRYGGLAGDVLQVGYQVNYGSALDVGNVLAGAAFGAVTGAIANGVIVALGAVGVTVSAPFAFAAVGMAAIVGGIYGPQVFPESWQEAVGSEFKDLWDDFCGIPREFAKGADITSDNLREIWDNLWDGGDSWRKRLGDELSDLGETLKDATYRIVRWCPIALDLNSDGVISTRPDNDMAGPMFDFDGDGIRTATGWVGPDDGLLVRDLDLNGAIDSGAELFGEHTKLSDGTLAADGFEALRSLDDNSDGLINAQDAAFSSLKVWRDRNGDGISQAGELLGLDQFGVVGLSTAYVEESVDVAGGQLIASGTFTRAGVEDGVETHVLQDFDFDADTINSQYVESVEVPQHLIDLPNLSGFGKLRDLREACALSPALAQLVREFSLATTRESQRDLLDDVLLEWARTSPTYTEALIRRHAGGGVEDPNSPNTVTLQVGAMYPDNWEYMDGESLKKIRVVEAIMGYERLDDIWWSDHNIAVYYAIYQKAFDYVYESLALKTRLAPYIEAINIVWRYDAFVVDFSEFDDVLYARSLIDWNIGISELKELKELRGDQLAAMGWSWKDSLVKLARQTGFDTSFLQAAQQALGVVVMAVGGNGVGTGAADIMLGDQQENTLSGAGGDDLLLGDAGDDVLMGGAGHDVLYGGVGHDQLNGDAGNDQLYGDDGDDALSGGSGNDVLVGGAGNDTLNGGDGGDTLEGGGGNDVLEGGNGSNVLRGGAGDDTLKSSELWGSEATTFEGGTGNDTFYGGANDTYLFGLGDGQDVIYDSALTDVLQFGDGIAQSDLSSYRSGNDLVLLVGSGGDQITIKNWYAKTSNWIETFKFADGMTLTAYDLFYGHLQVATPGADALFGISGSNAIIHGGDGNDIITAGSGADQLYGDEGDDTLSGSDGNDVLVGGAGNDTLNGGNGSDTLEGGGGDDVLEGGYGSNVLRGGAGDDTLKSSELWGSEATTFEGGTGNDTFYGGANDTYLFGLGDGQDVIYDSGLSDTLQFGSGIDADEVWLERTGNDLMISILGTTDSVLIKSWYSSVGKQVEKIVLSDGRYLTPAETNALVSAMAGFAKPASSETSIPEPYRQELMPQLAANW